MAELLQLLLQRMLHADVELKRQTVFSSVQIDGDVNREAIKFLHVPIDHKVGENTVSAAEVQEELSVGAVFAA